ncbi:hypothetical protein ACWD6R_32625 [Streptomyces sp. NPDC005151]
MGDAVLTTSATITCPHGGQGSIASPSQSAAQADSAICTEDDQVTIAGCPFMIGPNPSPCMSVQWKTSSTACTAGGTAILTISSVGLCMSPANAPQGPVQLSPAQTSVTAT